jgi:hypothetical protein
VTDTLIEPTAVATIDTDAVAIEDGLTTLDSGAVPYATATLTLPLLSDEKINWLDPRERVRVPYSATTDGSTPRLFDLGLRKPRIDHAAKSVTLTLASDEALLMDWTSLTTDDGARAHESSLRGVCDYVLDKIGASLEAGDPDADVTAYWEASNLVTNPCAATAATGWEAGPAGLASLSRVTGLTGANRTTGLRATSSTSGYFDIRSEYIPVTAGRRYYAAADLRASSARQVQVRLEFYEDTTSISQQWTEVSATTAFTQQVSVSAEAPPRANKARVFVRSVTGTSGQWVEATAAILVASDYPVSYFDAASTGGGYTYAPVGIANESATTRTPLVERRPELFTMKPGDNAWDFLLALTSAAGMVLWCDELRRWRLATPESRTIVHLISVTTGNTSGATDELDIDDDESFVTGVVVRYRWQADGIERVAYDTAGTPEKVLTVDIDRPYPGPGAAAAILARRQGSGRRQEVTVVTQRDTTPGMTAQLTLPAAPDTVGRVQSVAFNHRTGFMTLGLAGLVDIIPGTIAALSGTIDDLVGTIDSL